jgi:hypothetical protein
MEMEDKWAGQYDGVLRVPQLQFCRSWTGAPWYRVPITHHTDETASTTHFWVALRGGKGANFLGFQHTVGALLMLLSHRSIVHGLLLKSSAYSRNSDGEKVNVLMSDAELWERMRQL